MSRRPSAFERGLLRAMQAARASADQHPDQFSDQFSDQPSHPSADPVATAANAWEAAADPGTVAGPGPLTVNVYAARNRLSELLQRVEAGETVIIARAGEPVAQLSRWLGEATSLRGPGSWAGKIRHCPSFNRPFGQERP
jgi:Antitoxin Phd_YefM, type II toxin-antitoxin system